MTMLTQLATQNETTTTQSTARPVKAIRAELKRQAQALAVQSALESLVAQEGVHIGDRQWDVTPEDIRFAIRTTFNAIMGPDMSYDDKQAGEAYDMLTQSADKGEEAA